MDYINNRSTTLTGAKLATAKDSVIVLSDSKLTQVDGYPAGDHTYYLPFGDFDKLTVQMALTFGDLAAVVVLPHLYQDSLHMGEIRRIKQLSSAEGAVMIWDEVEGPLETKKFREAFRPDYFLRSNQIKDLNHYETEFVQMEIFKNHSYLKHGLEIRHDSVIVDIGANIGLFTLFAKSLAPECKVYAFEPSKEVFKILSENTKQISGVKLFNQGVSNVTTEKEFTYYPGYSVISGFYTDLNADEAVILAGEKFKTNPVADEVIKGRFDQQQIYLCPVVSLSDFIKSEGLKQIDYLKIDAEKSELLILEGLSFEDWQKIQQIVLEVHGEENQQTLLQNLRTLGFTAHSELGIKTSQESIYTVYGKKQN